MQTAPEQAGPEDNAGQAEIVALALSTADVTNVTVTVTGNGLTTPLVSSLKKSGGSWTSTVAGIPAGSGYKFTLNASDSNGTVLYTGTASPVTIVKGQSVQVVINAQQVNPPTPFQNAAPVLDSVVVSKTTVSAGETISLTATAHDPNPGDAISYAWTASAGTFGSASASTTTWVAPTKVGTYPITLAVRDPAGATVSVQVTITVSAGTSNGSAAVTVDLNTWPVVANVAGTPAYLVKGAQTVLTAIASDADGDSLTYAWTSTCPGSFNNTQVPMPGFTLDGSASATSCTLAVVVGDGRGGTTTGSLTLPVGKPTSVAPPTLTSTSQSADTVGASDTVTFSVQASDPQGLALTFAWTASGGTLGTPTNSAGKSQVVWTPPSAAAASWSVGVTVTDSAGLVTPYTFTVRAASCFGPQPAAPEPWRFGIISDTQWTVSDDGKNPNSVAVDIINQVNTQFIAQGVKFVVAVGDVTDNGSKAALDTRAEFAQTLYNAGVGFFPLRGNHESSSAGAAEFVRVFPQTRTGQQNATPADALISNPDDVNTHPVVATGAPFSIGSHFSSPSTALTGLSYAFDYQNARFVLLDMFTPADSSANSVDAQQGWVSSTLSGRSTGTHAFVFGHKGLITEDHVDTLFGDDPTKDAPGQNAFISSLATNGVRYYIGGHDHMHNRALVTTTDGTSSSVQDIICASDSSKFYTPANPSNDDKYDVPAFGHKREIPITQEINTIGYYVATVVGDRVQVDFYSTPANPAAGFVTTPALNFAKRESFGYGLNGKEFIIAPDATYNVVSDSHGGTTAQILGGTNSSTAVDGSGRRFSKTVDTAWSDANCTTSSAILSLSVTGILGTGQTDTYALSMSYDAGKVTDAQIANGGFGIAVKKADGNWANIVDKNFGGTKTFVSGPWQPSYPLGTYGVDAATHSAWAVVNSSGDFAVTSFAPLAPVAGKILAINDLHGQISAGKTVSGHPVGGAAVLASYLKTAMSGREDRTILVEAGDLVGASPASSALLQDEPTVDFFNYFANAKCAHMPLASQQTAGTDRFDVLFDPGCNLVGIPGNHEFDEGVDELMRLLAGGNHPKGPFLDNPWAGARFPVVAANIVKANGDYLFRPYVIKSIGGVRVAFVGAVIKDTPNIVIPAGVAGLTFGDEADAINAQVAALKSQGIHAIVAVIHNGGSQTSYNGPTDATKSAPSSDVTSIINRLDAEVDIAITAHSHSFTNALVKNAGNKDVLVTQAYSAGTAYADIDLTLDPATGEITAKSATIPTTYADATGLVLDPAMTQLASAAEAMVGPIANTVITTVSGVLSRTQTSAGESPLGDLVAEAQRVAVSADFGITNPGGLRADLPTTCSSTPCNVTWNDCFTAQPFGNVVMSVQLTGQQLYDALEQQWAGQTSPKMLQISGFKYEWSASAPVGSRIVAGSLKKADGTPIDRTASYRVALNNFLQGGGDGFTVFKNSTGAVAGPVDVDALLAYLKTITQPLSQATDGRISVNP